MGFLIFMLIYTLGVFLAYGRLFAEFYEIDKISIKHIPPDTKGIEPILLFLSLFSYLTLFVGIVVYITDRSEYLFKWSNKDLWEIYYANNPKN